MLKYPLLKKVIDLIGNVMSTDHCELPMVVCDKIKLYDKVKYRRVTDITEAVTYLLTRNYKLETALNEVVSLFETDVICVYDSVTDKLSKSFKYDYNKAGVWFIITQEEENNNG